MIKGIYGGANFKYWLRAIMLTFLMPLNALASPFTMAVGALYADCVSCYTSGAMASILSDKSKTFYSDHYTKSISDMLSTASIELHSVVNANIYGEYLGSVSPDEKENIYIASWLLELACCDAPPPGKTADDVKKARELLEDTIGHELVHWADMHDDGINNNGNLGAGVEEGDAWEVAVFGKVKMLSNATGNYLSAECPEPPTLALFGLGMLLVGLRRKKSGNA